MPKKDKNNLFKFIIHKKYKEDEIRSTLLFHRRINFLFKRGKIFEEDVLNLAELFNEKMNINDKISKVIEVARLLKKADDLNSVYEILDELPPSYFVVNNWEHIDEEDIENENKIMIAESNGLNKEKPVPISNIQKTFSKQDMVDSGICLDTTLSTSELMHASTTIQL